MHQVIVSNASTIRVHLFSMKGSRNMTRISTDTTTTTSNNNNNNNNNNILFYFIFAFHCNLFYFHANPPISSFSLSLFGWCLK